MTADLKALLARVEGATGPDREIDRALVAEIEARIEYDPNGGCWLWTGRAYEQPPYGRPKIYIMISGRQWLANRASYWAYSGHQPGAGFVCHHCDNPWCVNPAHLYLGNHRTNMDDMARRHRAFASKYPERAREVGRRNGLANTWARGAGNPKARLNAKQAAAIRSDTRKTKAIAEEYGVHRTTVQRIRRNALWTS
jgi:HNH endonuclease